MKAYSIKFILSENDIRKYYDMTLDIRNTLFDKQKHGISLTNDAILISSTDSFNEKMINFYIDKYNPLKIELYCHNLRDFSASNPSERYSKDVYQNYTIEHFVNIDKTSVAENIVISINKDKINDCLNEILSLLKI